MLPRKLEKTVHRLAPMVRPAAPAIQLVASKEVGETVSRQSIRSLYAMAYALHRPQTIITTRTTTTPSSPSTEDTETSPSQNGSASRGSSSSTSSSHREKDSKPGASSSSGSNNTCGAKSTSSSSSVVVWSALPYHGSKIETSAEKNVSSSQIGGQLKVLLGPVLRRLEDRVREAQRLFGDREGPQKKKKNESGKADGDGASRPMTTREEEERRATAVPENLSDEEEALDEELEQLLQLQAKKKRRKSKKNLNMEEGTAASKDTHGGGGGGDAWRYAFGKGNADEEEQEEGVAEEEEEEEDARVLARHSRAMKDANVEDEEENEDEEEEEGDANDELAALKEMYGEDFDAEDGEGFLEGEENGEDGSEEGEEEEEGDHPASFFREQDGKYFGAEDMLQDPDSGRWGGEDLQIPGMGDWGDDPTQVPGEEARNGAAASHQQGAVDAELAKDEELQAFLQRTDVSDLQKELMIEKKKVYYLEQRRLYGVNRWSMTGEVNVTKRPRDALLELEDIDFEYGMKSVPVITEVVSQQLEARIKDRILKNLFDDVVRRSERNATVGGNPEDLAALNARKKQSEDEKKSSLSLMDLYEKEIAEKQRLAEERGADGEGPSATPLTQIERDELQAIQMWKRLSQHLDALSNFYFTPKPIQQDLEARVRAVDGQAPALLMESVGAFATSRETALAPQDVYRPKGDGGAFLTGSAERTPEERRAHRRRMKERFAVKKKIVEQSKQKVQRRQEKEKEANAAAGVGVKSGKK